MRDLTVEDVLKLSLELKVCFMIVGWNLSSPIVDVNTWAREVGYHNFYEDGACAYEKAVKDAIEEANKTIAYVKRFILMRDDGGKIWN